MRVTRSLLAAASSLIWPTVVLAIPMGITFGAARVYAEAGKAPPPACTESIVTACADAGAMHACDCGASSACACTPEQCVAASGVTEALVCKPVLTACSAYAVAPCEGKAADAACVQTDTAGKTVASGTCRVLPNGCLVKNDGGVYETSSPLACAAALDGTGASTTTPATKSDDADGGSGCSMPPGAIGSSTPLAMPLAMGLAAALRRRRRR